MEELEFFDGANELAARKESNKTVDEAMRKKGMLIFTFDKNCHKIDISKKEYEDIKIRVCHYSEGACDEYVFGLKEIYEYTGDFARLGLEYLKWKEGQTLVVYENEFTFEKFVGKNLDKKRKFKHIETECYNTGERLSSIYFRVIG